MKNRILWLTFITLLTFSCKNNDIYLRYNTIISEGWNKDSVQTFNIPISDINVSYNVFVNIEYF